jgi:tetratricopeptide (TPR) repeat protein
MRKGRSQRKTRGSLPPLSTRPQAAGAAESSPPRSRGPQVVIGLAGPRSEDSGETREARGPEASPASRGTVITQASPKLEILAEPTLELVREAERLELALEQEVALEQSLEAAREREALEALEYALEESQPVDSLSGVEREAVSDPFARALTLQERQETPIPIPHVTTLPTPEELSIPPMGDLAVEPVAERFFSEGEHVAVHGAGEEEAWDQEAQDKVKRKLLPHVVERRQRFSRYVRWAVAGAAVVCLAALARTTMTSRHAPVAAAASPANTAVVAPEPKAPEPVAVAAPAPEVAVSAPVVDVPKAEEPKAEEPKVAAEVPKAAEPAKTEDVKPVAAAAPAAPGDKTALQEKNDARRNLERGKLADAIAAGERSVALDPQDGEAWLLLGAAYQEKGNRPEARRCYTSCMKEGKRGPIGECRAMIR